MQQRIRERQLTDRIAEKTTKKANVSEPIVGAKGMDPDLLCQDAD